jgi:hypothetical protein
MPVLSRSLRWMDGKSPVVVCSCGVLSIGCIGYLSYVTGPQLSSSLFYLIPVLLVTRVTGFRLGFLAATLAAMAWLAVDLNAGLANHPVIPYWNALMRLGTFLVAVGLVSSMRSLNTHLEQRVTERTAALEAQIAEKRELEKTFWKSATGNRPASGRTCTTVFASNSSAPRSQPTCCRKSSPGIPRPARRMPTGSPT